MFVGTIILIVAPKVVTLVMEASKLRKLCVLRPAKTNPYCMISLTVVGKLQEKGNVPEAAIAPLFSTTVTWAK